MSARAAAPIVAIAMDFLRRNGYHFEVDYGRKTGPLWQKALTLAPTELGLGAAFYREEWERVVQPQEVTTLEDYYKASRVGRGTKLSRRDRKAVWAVFEEYRISLNEHGLRESADAFRDARTLLESKGNVLPYRAIIVDEAQDFGPQAFRLIRQMLPGADLPNDLFIVGDGHQRIYRHKVTLSKCGINVRGRSRQLRINYRTTEETRRWADSLPEGMGVDDLDDGKDEQKGYKSLMHGTVPEVRHFASFKDEVAGIEQYVKTLQSGGHSLDGLCVVSRTEDLVGQYEGALREKGFDTYRIRRSEPEDRCATGIRLATMHRVKGLEFDRVIIAGVSEGVVPLQAQAEETTDTAVLRELENRDRALLYVSATRAKTTVLVTSHGKPSRFLQAKQRSEP